MAKTFNKILYQSWFDMKRRCLDIRSRDYPRYGARGIKVCERWLEYANFLEDMAPTHKIGLTLDRIDNNADYSPQNCRWATRTLQANNRRTNRVVLYQGVSDTLANWGKKSNIKSSLLRQRFYVYRWPLDKCLNYQKGI